MSVVNKMLQDLEARQSQTNEINADYQPPQKKRSKLLVLILLTLAIATIIYVITGKSQLFDKNKNGKNAAPALSQSTPPAVIKKMTITSEKTPPQTASTQPAKAKIEQVDTEAVLGLTNNEMVKQKKILTQESSIATNQAALLQNGENPNKPLEIQNGTETNIQASPEQKPSFSMTGSSQKNNASSLKQRIADNLNNDNVELARSLLHQLLEMEPDNIKARKKLASLLFAQGNYPRSKQLLLQGIELHPAQSDLKLMLARLYVVQKEPLQAMNILAGSQPSLDNQIEYLAYRAALAQQLKQTELAKSDYQTLTNNESSNAKWWLGLGIANDQLGDIKMAVQAYNKASSLDQLDGSVNEFIQQRISVLVSPE